MCGTMPAGFSEITKRTQTDNERHYHLFKDVKIAIL
jgi:hypothetical protein